MRCKRFLGSAFLLLGVLSGAAWADEYAGQVVDAQTGAGLPGAELASPQGSVKTDAAGRFVLTASDPAVWVRLPGYRDRQITLAGRENRVALDPLPVVQMPVVKVRGKADAERVVVSKRKIDKAEIKAAPVALFPDVSKVLQLMPGVTTGNDFSSLMFVRGGGYNEMIAVLDDMIILVPYMWGGRVSVFNPNLIESVEFSTGGFSAEWPQAMSAILNVRNKVGNAEKVQGYADLSSATLDAFLEGPAAGPAGSSFLAGLRRTQYDLVYKLFSSESQVWPYFYDGQVKLNFPLGAARLTVNSLFSVEGMTYTMKKEEGYGSAHAGDSSYHYLDRKINLSAAYAAPLSETVSTLTLLGCFYNDGSYQGVDAFSPFDSYQNQTVLQLRHNWTWVPDRRQTLKAGIHFFPGTNQSNVKAVMKVPTAANRYYEETIDHTFYSPWSHFTGAFVQDQVELIDGFLFLNPSVNAAYYSLNHQGLWDPRFGLKARITSAWDLYAAYGRYSQFPLGAQYVDAKYGNPNLKAEEAVHAIVGTKVDLAGDYFFQLEGFYKDYRHLIVSDPDPAVNFANHAIGHAYGYDLIFQKKLGGKWDGWLTYSWVVSERKITRRSDPGAFGKPAASEPVNAWYRSDADITHAVNIILNYNFNPKWKLAFTQKYSTGKPYTPVVGGAYQPAIDEYTPVTGAFNGSRMPPYMTTDLKLSMPFFELPGWSSYVQVSNLFDVKNVDAYQYRTDYSESRAIYQLPRMILGGFRYEF
jgi:hypothetical protein